MKNCLNPFRVEPGLDDILEGLFDGLLDEVGVVHGNALKSNAEDCVTSACFIAFDVRKKRKQITSRIIRNKNQNAPLAKNLTNLSRTSSLALPPFPPCAGV